MDLKELKIRKNEILDSMSDISARCVKEKRNKNTAENIRFQQLERELSEVENEIEIEKNILRSNSVCVEGRNSNYETRKVSDGNMKEFKKFLVNEQQKQYIEKSETRAVGVSLKSENTAVVPQNVSDQIVKKLVEYCPLFSGAQMFKVGAGELNIPVETEDNLFNAAFVGENNAVAVHKVQLDTKKLVARRCGAAIQVTEQLILDSGANIEEYVVDLLARRMSVALNKAALVGNRDNGEFEGVMTNPDVERITVSAIDANSLIQLTRTLNPEFNPVMLMNRETFKLVSQLTDQAGNYVMVHDFRAEKPVYHVQGAEVFVDVNLENNQILLVDPKHALAAMIKSDLRVKRIDGDTENALKGLNTFVMDFYGDMICVNPAAAVILEVE